MYVSLLHRKVLYRRGTHFQTMGDHHLPEHFGRTLLQDDGQIPLCEFVSLPVRPRETHGGFQAVPDSRTGRHNHFLCIPKCSTRPSGHVRGRSTEGLTVAPDHLEPGHQRFGTLGHPIPRVRHICIRKGPPDFITAVELHVRISERQFSVLFPPPSYKPRGFFFFYVATDVDQKKNSCLFFICVRIFEKKQIIVCTNVFQKQNSMCLSILKKKKK